jgi:hypothetical protein
VAILEDVGFDRQILTHDPFHGKATAVDQRLQILDYNGGKSPKHGAMNQRRFSSGERGNLD